MTRATDQLYTSGWSLQDTGPNHIWLRLHSSAQLKMDAISKTNYYLQISQEISAFNAKSFFSF